MRIFAAGSLVVVVVLAITLVPPPPMQDMDSKARDMLAGWAGPGKQSGRVVIIEIDENSLAQFGRWPWPRDLVGRLSEAILNQGAAAVALDMMFPEQDGANDEALAAAISGKPVVVGYSMRFESGQAGSLPCAVPSLPLAVAGPEKTGDSSVFHANGAVCSVPAISRAASASGFLNAAPDRDGTLRRIPMVIEYGDRYYPSLALAALDLYEHISAVQLGTDAWGARQLRVDHRVIPLEGRSTLMLRFRGARGTFPHLPAADVLAGRVPAGMLRSKIAVVGGSALGIESPVATPVDQLLPDVEVQATAIDDLLQGNAFRRPGQGQLWELLLAVLVGLAAAFLLARLRPWWGAVITVALTAGIWAGCALLLSSGRVLISPFPATVMVSWCLPILTLMNYLQEHKRANRAHQLLTATRQRSREVLRESESRYERLVENINDAIIMDDAEGRLVFANRRFREWFGLKEEDIRGVVLEQYVAPEWRAQVRDRNDRRMRGESVPDPFEFEGIRPDGTRIWIEALVTTVEEDGRIIGSQSALRDLTERKRIEEQYMQAQKMESIGRLAGGVAHDFNNLLTVINGYSGMMLSRLPPGDSSRQALEQIYKAGERAAELTQKLLAFSRKQVAKPRPLNLNLLVSDAEKMLSHVIGEDVRLITRLSPELGSAIADPGQIHQVLMNLVVNARDAMPNGGTVTVETKNVESDAANPQVYLGITDTGTGMTDEVKQRLYEPFFTTKGEGKGTGLGLATVYGIVHQNKGRIEVSSELGRGTTFQIYLPQIKAALTAEGDSAAPARGLQGSETVLVVEDQEAVRELATTILESYGYTVLRASNGEEGMAMAERYPAPIHLLLTDIILPVMDGRVLAEKLKAARPEIKVLYITGYSAERIGQNSELSGDLAYLSKPFTAEALAARVREILTGTGVQHSTG